MENQQAQSSSTCEPLKNNMKVTWKKTSDCTFPLREGQCSCSHGNKMYLFGGVIQGQTEELVESNELLCYDVVSDSWSKVDAKGDIPPGRSAASLVAVGNKLYLFGGLSHMSGWTDSLHVFDLDTSTWLEKKSEGPKPSPRDKLQGTAVDTRIYYFGGFGPVQTGEDNDEEWEDMDDDDDDIIEEERSQQAAQFKWFNDLYVYDTVTEKWQQPMQMNLGVPTPRAAHAMCSVDRDLHIFGGRDTEKRQNDLHIFNVDTRKWNTELKTRGQLPVARSFHTATAVGRRIVVIGGRGSDNQHLNDFNVYDTDTCEWLQPTVEGVVPAARDQHSAATVGDKLVLFGGSSGFSLELMICQNFHGDTFTLDIADVLKGGSLSQAAAEGQTNGHRES